MQGGPRLKIQTPSRFIPGEFKAHIKGALLGELKIKEKNQSRAPLYFISLPSLWPCRVNMPRNTKTNETQSAFLSAAALS